MNIGGLVLNKIMYDPTNDSSLEAWAKLKIAFFNSEYIPIYSAIVNHYDKVGTLPSFNDLDVSIRDGLLKRNIQALSKLKVPEDVDISLAVDSLIDEYTQEETLKQLESFIDNITLLDTEEIKQELSNIHMYLEEKTHTSEKICLMSDITIIEDKELQSSQIALGINNTFDSEIIAFAEDLIMIGGMRGSGKSIVSANIFANQYNQGKSSLYFTIEMTKRETFNRTISILAGVKQQRIRTGELLQEDYDKIAVVRKNMFLDTDVVYSKYLETKNYSAFETDLITNYKLKPDNQLVIIDNQRLTLADIDVNIQKFKSQFGNSLQTVIVDYVNQIEIDDIYNWSQQITLSKQLKNIARKHGICMITPYQIDTKGEARFAKGILDAADIAFNLQTENDHIKFNSVKTRGTKKFEVASGIEWETLQIDPADYICIDTSEKEETEEELPF